MKTATPPRNEFGVFFNYIFCASDLIPTLMPHQRRDMVSFSVILPVPVRVASGLLFELLGHSVGDPFADEDDVIPIVPRSLQAQNFLVSALHVKGSAQNINVLGIAEVQELLAAVGITMPRTIHEVISHLASRLACWDDRLFHKSVFWAANEVVLKFMNRRSHEDNVQYNFEPRNPKVINPESSGRYMQEKKLCLSFFGTLRGDATRQLLEQLRKNTIEMIAKQEAVCGRLFTIQNMMQSTICAWLQDKSLTVQHNLGVFGGCGFVLSIITGLLGSNVDGIPGAAETPYAFGLFSAALVFLGVLLIGIGLVYPGLKIPIVEEDAEVRKLELQKLVKLFQQEAESPRTNPTAAARLPNVAGDTERLWMNLLPD
ncbi:hypothetical protein ACLB2K_067180 [Fragaria x ananassa]